MSSDLGLILRTASFAARAHRTQTRKNLVRTPYINHPLQVSELIATPPSSLAAAPPPVILQAALLHDVLEDTDVTSAELRAAFGDQVLSIVLECSDDMRETSEVRKERQVREANGKSVEAKHVKLADKLSNLLDLQTEQGRPKGWSVQRVQNYFIWSKRVTDQCAHVNPGLAGELEKLYVAGMFIHEGREWKCHPDYVG